MRCEEEATDSTGTDLHNGAQIPRWFLFNTSLESERRVRRREGDGGRERERAAARRTDRKKQQLVIEQTAEDWM